MSSSRSRLGQHLATNDNYTGRAGAVTQSGRPSQTRANYMYQVGRDVRLLFLTGLINQNKLSPTDDIPRRTSFRVSVNSRLMNLHRYHLLSLPILHISRAPNTQKDPTIPPPSVSPSRRRLSLVARVHTISGHGPPRPSCFQLPSPANPPSLHRLQNRGAKGPPCAQR